MSAKKAPKNEWPADKVERRRGVRERVCAECGAKDQVRADNKSERCKSCAGRAAGALGLKSIRARAAAAKKPCSHCSAPTTNKQFCSRSCRAAAASRVERECKCCGSAFSVLESALRSNASGNFCGRPCYEKWLCRTDRITGRGSQWRKHRQAALRRAPFCAMCGTTRRLQVHHIIPFRLTQDNSPENLIPLCVKHHRLVETILVSTEEFGFDDMARLAWISMLKERQMVTAAKIREAARVAV